MSHTQAIVNFFHSGNCQELPNRCFFRSRDGYKVVYHQACDESPKMIARFNGQTIEVPQSAIMNGYGCTEWNGVWHQVPHEEFLKDFGRAYCASHGTVDYSA